MANEYRNKEWLYNKYWNEELSQAKISRLCGVCCWTIWYWLKKYNIPIRSLSESIHLGNVNHCNLSQEAIEWIQGELLGDGCLTTTAKKDDLPSNNLSALFRYSSKYEEYINYISDTLKSFGVEQSGEIIKQYDKRYNNYSYKYNSRSYKELMDIYKQWYPNGKKIIPKDIILTPLTCRQWYIGDGSLIQRRMKRIKPYIILCSCGFLIEDVNRAIRELNNLGIKATRHSMNMIYISVYFVKYFLNYIGKCPVKCYRYKWLYQKGDEA